jgi:hypothetical protein
VLADDFVGAGGLRKAIGRASHGQFGQLSEVNWGRKTDDGQMEKCVLTVD